MKIIILILFVIVAVFTIYGVLYFGPLYPSSVNYSDYTKVPADTSDIDNNRYYYKCCGHDLGGVMAASYNKWIQKNPLGNRITYVYYDIDNRVILATSDYEWFFETREEIDL